MPTNQTRTERLTRLGRKAKVFAARGPAYHFSYGRWRLRRWLAQRRTTLAQGSDRDFFDQLDLKTPALKSARQAQQQDRADATKKALAAYFATRMEPRFFFEPGDVTAIVASVEDRQQEATIRTAAEICQNTFNFRGAGPIAFDGKVNWTHRPRGNIDWTWDLNRHAYFETLGRAYHYTGDDRFASKFRDLLLDWLTHNPPGIEQPNWASAFEVGFRINTWIWALYHFRGTPAFDPDTCLSLLKGLLAHGRILDANLELHVENNHLLLEAKALAMLGYLFPEFKAAARWRKRSLNILFQQIRAQVCPDGVHGERATHYHRVIAGELLELLTLLENNDVPIPPDVRDIFARMVEFELWVTKPDGRIPLLADSALEDTYLRYAATSGGALFLDRDDLRGLAPPLTESNLWLLGPRRLPWPQIGPNQPAGLESRAFPTGGYFVMRHGCGSAAAYLVFDCGPFGYKPVPGHGHADALSFELHANNQTWLIDPGVYSTYLGQKWRNFFRGSRAHNTVVVDELDQSHLLDSWRVYDPAQATLHEWQSGAHFDFVDGSHGGYERLPDPIRHRRQVFFAKPGYWVVIDSLTGRGEHCFDIYFHLSPGLATAFEPGSATLRARHDTKGGLLIAPLAQPGLEAVVVSGATNPIQGWVSFLSGERQPAPTLRYRLKTLAPVQFYTVLYPYQVGVQPLVTVSRLSVDQRDQPATAASKVTGLTIETGRHIDYLVFDPAAPGQSKTFGGYETDARLVYLRHRQEDLSLTKAIARGGTQISFRGQSLLDPGVLSAEMILDVETADQYTEVEANPQDS